MGHVFSSLISSSSSLCLSFGSLDLLLYSSPFSFPPEMGQKMMLAVTSVDEKPGMSHNDQQPQQHTAWGTTLACAAENKTRVNIAYGIQSYILEAPASPLAPCPHTANTSSTGLLSPSHHADKI